MVLPTTSAKKSCGGLPVDPPGGGEDVPPPGGFVPLDGGAGVLPPMVGFVVSIADTRFARSKPLALAAMATANMNLFPRAIICHLDPVFAALRVCRLWRRAVITPLLLSMPVMAQKGEALTHGFEPHVQPLPP
jgi:hypothetical protein